MTEDKKTPKEKLIDQIKELPDDIQFYTGTGPHDNIDIIIFTKPKNKAFLEWFFGP